MVNYTYETNWSLFDLKSKLITYEIFPVQDFEVERLILKCVRLILELLCRNTFEVQDVFALRFPGILFLNTIDYIAYSRDCTGEIF